MIDGQSENEQRRDRGIKLFSPDDQLIANKEVLVTPLKEVPGFGLVEVNCFGGPKFSHSPTEFGLTVVNNKLLVKNAGRFLHQGLYGYSVYLYGVPPDQEVVSQLYLPGVEDLIVGIMNASLEQTQQPIAGPYDLNLRQEVDLWSMASKPGRDYFFYGPGDMSLLSQLGFRFTGRPKISKSF